MAAVGLISSSVGLRIPSKCSTSYVEPRICFVLKTPRRLDFVLKRHPNLSIFFLTHLSVHKDATSHSLFCVKAASSSSTSDTEEPATKVKFQPLLNLPGCTNSLSLLGTGYREKVFAIIGVKVYAAGFYISHSILSKLDAWRALSADNLKQDSALFDTILKAPQEKSLQIVLVRDVDGKTFWDALDEAISPRIKQPTPATESALSSFSSIFQSRSLNKGTFIFLTWLDPNKMLVSVSSEGMPSTVDTTIESNDVTSSLFDVFFGGDPVSPSLKDSVANGLAAKLK